MHNFYRFHNLSKHTNLTHFVTLKSHSHPLKFSLGLHTGEDIKSVIDNRLLLHKTFNSKDQLYVVANQTHSSHVTIVDTKYSRGWSEELSAIKECDSLITNLRQVALCILTADCVPILLYDKKLKVISAIHAGWRGTQKEIVKKTIAKMIDVYGSNPTNIIASIAPSIGKCCYEVEEDVARYFSDTEDAYGKHKDKYMLDLPLINKNQLMMMGVKESHIEMSNVCTSCSVDRFFSHRKEMGCSGRFMSVISIN